MQPPMITTAAKRFSSFLVIFSLIFQRIYGATDTIKVNEEGITYGNPLVSSGGKFKLGFFSPGNSRKWYVGLWFTNVTESTVVWVANRDSPISDNSGVFKVIHPGILVLLNSTNGTAWASNATTSAQNPVAQLLDSGNLVVRDENDDRAENLVWQSFDHPTDTYLAGMDLGWDLVTGKEIYLSSWKSSDDPTTGEYTYHLDSTGYPQIVVKRGSAIRHRIGPWNGILFPGSTDPKKDPTINLTYVINDEKLYVHSTLVGKSLVSRYTLNYRGVAERWVWGDGGRGWEIYSSLPTDICDDYNKCGAYGSCNVGKSPPCGCLDQKFVPKGPKGWGGLGSDWSSGCVRRRNLSLSCQGDMFLKYSGIKLPDARKSWHNDTMTFGECRAECLNNCSCMAFTPLDVKKGSGCLIWYDELVDIRGLSENGQVIYIRMASTEAAGSKRKRSRDAAIIACSVVAVVLLLLLGLYLCNQKRKRKTKKLMTGEDDIPLWDLSVILKATDHFSNNNKLGEGGFGPVYKGVVVGGQEIAVKRLSKESRQGLDELKNEVIFIAKLQHRNLVKILGCCIQQDESMLIYEYLPNRSLDVILFDKWKSVLLNWHKRFHIINGIARGLLYLHQDSRLRIIHRDLKASNILLDSDMNPKISDFGLARSFGGNETEAQTHRVVGTYGYMSPEYAVDGLFSVKSDVFSFGVLVLEIVSGKRNRGFSHNEHSLNLLGHAWKLYKEGRSVELVDACLDDKFLSTEVLRSIQVGLLCVQQNSEDRPSMSTVVWMLGNEGEIAEAKHPGFFTERGVTGHDLTSMNVTNSTNNLTITMPAPR
ncbi:hypothetical protein ACS0TY_023403 [Phlomoides rotata]